MGGYVIWSFLSMYGVHSNISWSITHVFSYLGFVLLGSIIKDLWKRKSNCIGICMIVSGELLSILAWEMVYWSNIMHLGWNIKIFTGTFSPISIFIYILIFGGITMLKIQQNFKIIVKYSLYIYLFHKFILEIGAYVVKNWGLIILNNPYSYIPVMVTIVFMTSLLFSTIYLAGNNFIQLILKKRRDCDGI